MSLRTFFYLAVILWFVSFFFGCCGITKRDSCLLLGPMAVETPDGNEKLDKGGIIRIFTRFK